IRHMALKMETPVIDILAGQYWTLFGWQSYFHPNTVEIQGVPGEVYARTAQFRLSHAFKGDGATFEIAAAAARPPQRDAGVPDVQGGLNPPVNPWEGWHPAGATGSALDAAGLGVSGPFRPFAVNEPAASPTRTIKKNGWGVSVDALLPFVPASKESHANALTL